MNTMNMRMRALKRAMWFGVLMLAAACGLSGSAAAAMTAQSGQPAQSAQAEQAAQAETLTNEAVLTMVNANLGSSLIVAKIKASRCEFQTTVDDIVKLKAAGASDDVIQAMVEAGTPPAPVTAPAAPDPNDPKSPRDAGIYWRSKIGTAAQMVELEPTVYSGGETSGVFASALTNGIHKISLKAVVRGNRANQRITDSQPEFWFYFEETASLGPDPFWRGATSPNEFILAKLGVKKDERDLTVGEVGAFGSSTGTPSKDTIPFKTEKIAPGVYKVTPNEPIAPGEYCFFYGGGGQASGRPAGKLFDFGVDAASVAKQ
jgi:hypothetical protein